MLLRRCKFIMKYKRNDIKSVVCRYQKDNKPIDRYASFDYCYYYFKHSSSKKLLNNMEQSCLTIGFYLASWGMYRKGFLREKSVIYYKPLIEYIACLRNSDKDLWKIDVDTYNADNIKKILQTYNKIKEIIIKDNNSDLTLVTKILLGIFGFVPAYDTNFTNTFRKIFNNKDHQCGFRALTSNSLSCINHFYEANQEVIDDLSKKIYVKSFATGRAEKIHYTKAKIIDMYGFAMSSKLD